MQVQITGVIQTQNEILKTVLTIQDDIRIILAGTKESIVNIKGLIPVHPVSSSSQLIKIEEWLLAENENSEILVRYNIC